MSFPRGRIANLLVKGQRFFVASARVRDLLIRAKDLLERAKLLLWGPIASAIGARSLQHQILNPSSTMPEQHLLRLAVAAGMVAFGIAWARGERRAG
jgi:hypothetical protein